MPSSIDPNNIQTGAGKIHVDVITAAAELFSSGSAAMLASLAGVVSQSFATVVNQTFTAGVSGDATRILSVGSSIFLGTTISDSLDDLFKVVNAADNTRVYNPNTRQYVSVVGFSSWSVGDGFVIPPVTLIFNTVVPAGVVYKIYYGTEASLDALPIKMVSDPVIRSTDAFTSFPDFVRTGNAPNSISTVQDYTSVQPDPYLAQWKATLQGAFAATTPQQSHSGVLGYVHLGSVQNVANAADRVLNGVAGAAFFAANEKSISASTFGGVTVYTRINATNTAAITAGGQVTLNISDYFRITTPDRTAIKLGTDLLEITYSSGARQVGIITALDPSNWTTCTVVPLGGSGSFITDANVRVKWIRPSFFAGGVTQKGALTDYNLQGMSSLVPGAISTVPTSELEQAVPFFSSGSLDPARAGVANWNLRAFTWGSYTETGATVPELGKKTVNGELWGDGSIYSKGRVSGLINAPMASFSTAIDTAVTFDPYVSPTYSLTISGLATVTVTLSTTYTSNPFSRNGDQITFFVSLTGSTAAKLGAQVVWPATFKFSGSDGDVSSTMPGVVIMKYTGTWMNGSFYMTRTDYLI